jgi:hypothetical protein
MTIRAKFSCSSVQDFGSTETVSLNAVNGPKGTANAQWSKWTPSGSLSLNISNPDARGKFKPGGYYYLDIQEAPEGDDA